MKQTHCANFALLVKQIRRIWNLFLCRAGYAWGTDYPAGEVGHLRKSHFGDREA
jgi:hypothetical protein